MAKTKVHEQKNVTSPYLKPPTKKPLEQASVPGNSPFPKGSAKFGLTDGALKTRGPSDKTA